CRFRSGQDLQKTVGDSSPRKPRLKQRFPGSAYLTCEFAIRQQIQYIASKRRLIPDIRKEDGFAIDVQQHLIGQLATRARDGDSMRQGGHQRGSARRNTVYERREIEIEGGESPGHLLR